MATKLFVKLGLNGQIINSMVVDDSNCSDENNVYNEKIGIDFLTELTGWPLWKGTHNRNGNPALDGFYITDGDYFKCVSPYRNYVFNTETYEWEPPIPHPNPDNLETYRWDDDAYEADTANPKTQGWISKT